ncbi:hypothetical protein I552_8073 [Mycobacterium xenopi 3993]|nr:hypothetical protein I552_8073 [Mycobacterium xenopi 3993]
MSDRIVLEPSTEHPITIEPTKGGCGFASTASSSPTPTRH